MRIVQTILVVDDEFGVVEVLTAALEDEGYRVMAAANGRHGLERLAENRPDLVIVDFMMPILDGAAMATVVHDASDTAVAGAVASVVCGGVELRLRHAPR